MSTSISATIMEFLSKLFGDEQAAAEFLESPEEYLAANNLDHLSCADFDDAIVSFFENAEFHNTGGDNDQGGTFNVSLPGQTVAAAGQSDAEAIAQHLTNIVNEYGDTYVTNYDNDVINDNSFQGQIFAGGDVNFDNDIISASGDGAVAAGEDINGDVVTGDDNVVGDGNQVGAGAFGDGAVSHSSLSADDGSAISVAGDNATSTGSNDYTDDHSVTATATDSFNDNSDNSDTNTDSFNDNSDNSDDSDNSTTTTTTTTVDLV